MDSLTQITLGAAVGEIVLGRKVGNRALLWGAVGGTIPDLDVLCGLFLSPINDLAAHRGFSHSFVFAVLGGLGFGWVIDHIYKSKWHHPIAILGKLLIPFGVLFFISRFLERSLGTLGYAVFILGLVACGYYLYRKYYKQPYHPPEANRRDWQKLMFWSIFTHPLLDCFTTYGTQVFQPFNDYRVAFNAISVADPIYTVPFLLCVIALSYYTREKSVRRKLSWIGIGLSSTYLLFTVINKQGINSIWKSTLENDNQAYQRYLTSPTILNNLLWSCIAETDEGYLYGQYSRLDKEPKVDYTFYPRNQELLQAKADDPTLETLRWFCKDYYTITKLDGDTLQFNDMRFGVTTTRAGDPHYIFNFPIIKGEDGYYDMLKLNGGPPPGEEQDMLGKMWTRMTGKED